MEELNDQELNNESIEPEEEEELSHTDKLVGVLTAPRETFIKISKHPLKTSDWFLPLLISSIVALLSFYIMMMNANVRFDFEDKTRIEVEKSISKQLENGQLPEDRAEIARDMGLKWAKLMNPIMKFIGLWFILFFSALIYWLIIKFFFHDQGQYKTALVGLGMSYYILVFQSILTIILAYITNKFLNTPNFAEILGVDLHAFPDFLLSFLDVTMIWYFIVASIGLSALFKSASTTKYYILTFGVWIGLSLALFSIF